MIFKLKNIFDFYRSRDNKEVGKPWVDARKVENQQLLILFKEVGKPWVDGFGPSVLSIFKVLPSQFSYFNFAIVICYLLDIGFYH